MKPHEAEATDGTTDTEPRRQVSDTDSADPAPSSLKGLTMALGIGPAEPGEDPLLGRDIGGVTIVRLIAEGGMGRVYEGLQDKPRRPVAVKVMRPGLVSAEIWRRFDNESEVLGKLRHPYIAQIYSAGTHTLIGAQVPYFVMEYIDDALPFTRFVAAHGLALEQRLELFRKVCEAVAHGHEKGVIHRDLKPGNILVEPQGVPKVIDFGVSRTVDASPEYMTALTDVGQLIGTLQYMSPEQFTADPEQIDTRTDVYALGVILYELLTGKLPYEIRRTQTFEAAEIVRRYKPLRPSQHNPTIRPEVEAIADICLQKDKAARYGDAKGLSQAIAAYLTGKPSHAQPAETAFRGTEDMPMSPQANPPVPPVGNAKATPISPRHSGGPGIDAVARPRSALRAAGAVAAACLVIAGLMLAFQQWWSPPGKFPKGTVSFQGHTYLFPEDQKNQVEAKLAAQAAGGSLVVIDDRAENEFVAKNARGATWIGIERSPTGWTRLSDGAALGFTAWDRGQPSNGHGEMAVSTNLEGAWHDNYVSDVMYYCIEWPEVLPNSKPYKSSPKESSLASNDAAADPIVGRWAWFVNGMPYDRHEFLAGGLIRGFPRCSWLLADPVARKYQFAWGKEFLDVMTLSDDGMLLTGRNTKGDRIEGRRLGERTAPGREDAEN